MAERRQSTVARYLETDRPVDWKGGKGRRGPLANWLVREKAAIVTGKTPGAATSLLTWEEVARLAFQDGVIRKGGGPYRDHEVRKAWSDLAKKGLVPRLNDASLEPIPAAQPRQVQATQSGQAPQQPPPSSPRPAPTAMPEPRAPPANPGLPAGFEDLLNPGVVDPKKPNPPKV